MRLLLTLLLLPTIAYSAAQYSRTLGYQWDAPTERLDGTPLEPNELAGYELDHNGTIHQTTATEIDIVITQTGEHCARVRASDTDGQWSPWSDKLCTMIKAAPAKMIIRFSGVGDGQ